MEIIDYYGSDRKEHWLEEIGKSEWRAGQYLYELLRDGKLREMCGASAHVLMLTDGDDLVAFCTFADNDDIAAPDLTPWVGFVYTFPEYRGHRYMGLLLEHAYKLALSEGFKHIYISTGEIGLYEKYGYSFWKTMPDIYGEESRVYRIEVSFHSLPGNCSSR